MMIVHEANTSLLFCKYKFKKQILSVY